MTSKDDISTLTDVVSGRRWPGRRQLELWDRKLNSIERGREKDINTHRKV